MKRFFFAVALLAAMPVFAEHVDPETARKVATAFLANNGAKTETLTDLSPVAAFPNLYIFNAEEGFVVLSADDCAKPVLGYSLTGTFVAEGMPDHVSAWLQGYNDKIQYAIDHQVRASAETAQLWEDLAHGKTEVSRAVPVVDALVETQWNQGTPFNNLCPIVGYTRTVTGCVATAMAQIMKFWEWPITGTGSHSYSWNNDSLRANFGATQYDWAHMTNTYGSSSTSTEKTAVATLMYHCGVALEMDYGTSASSASTYKVMEALQTYFGYAPGMQYKSLDDYEPEVWITMLKRELDDGRPLQYRGSDKGGAGGHSFVCDGYDSDDKFHFNWGWGGYCDGFYSIFDMEPGTGGIGAGNGIYTVGESAIFGIEPLSSVTAPTLSASVQQNAVTLTWNAIEGATSYEVYKDNEKIATGVTETVFTDTDIAFGVHYEYYVRAVATNVRSNPSNHVKKYSYYRDITPSSLTVADDVLTWTGYPGGLSTDLHYGSVMCNYLYGTESTEDAYWGNRYPASTLAQLKGMSITKISTWFYLQGSYTMYLYSGNLDENTRTKLAEQSFTKTKQSVEWVDFNLSPAITIDDSEDLWVVFYADHSIIYPILFEMDYIQDDADDAKFLSSTLEGLFSSESIQTDSVSWIIYTHISDGSYTYNLYDGTTLVNGEPISDTKFDIPTPLNEGVHPFTVKTVYANGMSEASNTASLAVGSASLASLDLGTDDRMTVAQNGTLTVAGTLKSPVASHLMLEDGAQLIHSSDEVTATVRKRIEPYTANDNGWYFITNPTLGAITPSVDNGLLSGTYDLYYYDEPTSYWRNHKANGFDLTPQQGYLYANNALTTLEFAGTVQPSDQAITLSGLSHSATDLNGFNLVGNPFVCNATIDQDCYVINGNRVVLAATSAEIAPCEGVFVKASTTSESVTFSPSVAKGSEPSNSFDLALTCNQGLVDRVRVRFGEGIDLEKFNLDGDPSRLCFRQNGQDYAVVHADTLNALPLYFEPENNGSYTLAVDAMGIQMEYLHLIDHLTGADIDLLATPNYTFDANPSDFGARFQLVFRETLATDGFDFIDGQSQILDLTGRVVATDRNTRLAPGVYLIRTVDGNNVNIQKTIIK